MTSIENRERLVRSEILLAVVLLLMTAAQIAAQGIGLNFVGAAGPEGTLSPSDVAGAPPYSQPNWNNLFGSSGITSGLIDSLAQPTSLAAELRSIGGVGATTETGPTADFSLMRGYLVGVAPGTGAYLNNIPYDRYDVIVYMSGSLVSVGTLGRLGYVDLDSLAWGDSGDVLYAPHFTGTFVEATSSKPGNYYRFSGLSSRNLDVFSMEFNLTGFQVIAVPEPDVSMFLVFACAVLFVLPKWLVARRTRQTMHKF